MKNKLVLLSLIGLLVGCGSNNISSSSNKQSTSTKISTHSVSSSLISTTSTTSTSSENSEISSSSISINSTAPTLEVVDDLRININEKVNYLNLVSAYDEIDGNISHLINVNLPENVTLEDGYLTFSKVGNYEIEFTVTNSFNLTSSKSINIEVYEISEKDVDAPTILGYQNIRVMPNEMVYPLNGVTAIDDIDGDITSLLVATYQTENDATQGISFAEEGFYDITISVVDNAGNKTNETVVIEVNAEKLPTYVNMTNNILTEYNCNIDESSNVPVPYEGAQSKEVILKVKTSKIYANFKLAFDDPIDLENKQISMYVKMGDNVDKNRLSIDLRQGTVGVGQMQFIITESSGSGYQIEDKGDGWFLLTIVFKKVWQPATYVTDYLRLVFSNSDITKAANMYIADVLLDDYIDNGEEDSPNDSIEALEDLTDSMEVNYNSVLEIDKSISHDGIQSVKLKANDVYFSTKNSVEKDLNDYIISFYVKYSGDTIRKNRLYLQFKDNDDVSIIEDIFVSTVDELVDGVTLGEIDENGWSKVTVDCSKIGVGGVVTKNFIIKFGCNDTTTLDGVVWLDELSIVKKEV